MFREKKGTTIVEAAVVFPLVILTVITCVLVCMFFYSQTISQSALHIEMRDYAGQISGHTVYLGSGAGSHLSGSSAGSHLSGSGSSGGGSFVSGSTGGNRSSITKEKRGLFYIVRGKENVSMKNKGILSGRTDQTIESIWTASDGVGYVRYCTFGKSVAEDILDYK